MTKTKTKTKITGAKSNKKKTSVVDALKELFVFPRYSYKKHVIRILAGDPGIKNFGYTIIEASNKCFETNNLSSENLQLFLDSIKIIDCGFLTSCLTELRHDNIIPYIEKFHQDNSYLYETNPDYIVMERYQARDLRGPRNEVINFSIASILNKFLLDNDHSHAKLIIPAQWKRYYTLDKENKVKGLDLVYNTWKKDKLLTRTYKLTDHQTDAFLLGVYCLLDIMIQKQKDAPEVRAFIVNHLINQTKFYFKNYYEQTNK